LTKNCNYSMINYSNLSMTENTSNKKINKFDFVKPAKVEFSSGFSLEEQKKSIEKNFVETKKTYNTKSFAIIVSIIAISLAGLCGYTIWQLIDSNKNAEKAVLEKKSIVDNSIIISGEMFSIVLKSNPTVKFSKESMPTKIEILENKKSTTTQYITTLGNNKTAGVEITNTEYDNKLSQDSFNNKYFENLGLDYDISSEKTFLQRGFFTNKIIPKNNPDNIAFYPVVSSNNYYIIKTINPLKNDTKNAEVSKFVDDLITEIYLN
jgi:hypothetical protein